MHTILGSNGAVARELSRALALSSIPVRQVSRYPRKINQTDETLSADLLDEAATTNAVAGSDVVYLVAGLKYDASVWQEQWPRVMRNVINACTRCDARLVFLDNVYAYGLVDGWMTEETPFNPISKKGEVRARIASTLLDEIRSGNLRAMIARSADFYGPDVTNSLPYATVYARLAKGKSPQWIADPHKVHTFTYVPDIGKALAVLGSSDEAYGQTWHLPTSKEMLTAEDYIRLACQLAGQDFKLQVVPSWLRKVLGLVVPELRESEEMMYQFENDYRFDSSKIESAFGLLATDYQQGIGEVLK